MDHKLNIGKGFLITCGYTAIKTVCLLSLEATEGVILPVSMCRINVDFTFLLYLDGFDISQ